MCWTWLSDAVLLSNINSYPYVLDLDAFYGTWTWMTVTYSYAIEKRISVFSQIPAEHGEQIQVLRYEKDQFYKPHHDYFSDPFNIKRSQRIATMLMYLSDDVEGGETYFPRAGTGDCSCGGKVVKGMSIKPIKGDAVLFWSMGLDGQSDPNSLHGGCAVLSGEKWSATKWMRKKPIS
ncbi:hypothetical protein Goarm_012987 [Gossypium armourianum]|uniref:Fe2OG dioxygenase domain-containing protein n=1 Tax=Gossypium armourianum TaxID=34283 RepID=A0A7J9J4E0_9ROSI|nr:hypothetical protein [Gossypium armourianum]